MTKLSTIPLLIVIFLLFQNFSVTQERATATLTKWSSLNQDLKGYASTTSGGLDRALYVVTSQKDDKDLEGTLRYGVENFAKANGGAWITFAKSVFPPDTVKTIYLDSPLDFTALQNITIDGRGSHVSIRRDYNYADATWVCDNVKKVCECNEVENPSHKMGPVFKLRSSKNIIITHLEFLQKIFGTDPYPEGSGYEKDTQCFGDAIGIGNIAADQQTQYFDRIWINHNSFQYCGDECVSATRNSTQAIARVSVSNNSFKYSYKSMLIGIADDYAYRTRLSVYNNRFVGMKERSPRVLNQYAHVFNNLNEDYGLYAIGVMGDARILSEENVFRYSKIPALNPIAVVTKLKIGDAYVDFVNGKNWQRQNFLNGVVLPPSQLPILSSYPQDQASVEPIESNLGAFISKIRSEAGWKSSPDYIDR